MGMACSICERKTRGDDLGVGRVMVEQTLTRVMSFSPRTEEVVRWIP